MSRDEPGRTAALSVSSRKPARGAGSPEAATVRQGGRAKAYRPLPASQRAAALDAALAAWRRDDWFEAHELLEPAWMGTREPAERDLYQGLIKLAAAYVHGARGNRLGMDRNLEGAAERLRRADDGAEAADDGFVQGIAVRSLLAEVNARLRAAEPGPTAHVGPPSITRRDDPSAPPVS